MHDCGTLINPMIVEGQIHGGVAQGVGGALYERMEYAADGQLLNASFMDFLMPYASEVPDVEIDHLVTPSPLNPLGVKGAGEAGVIPGSAAIAAAIEDAEGITITRMPISPERAVRTSRHGPRGEPHEDHRHRRPSPPTARPSGGRSTTRPCWPGRSRAASGSRRSATTPTP